MPLTGRLGSTLGPELGKPRVGGLLELFNDVVVQWVLVLVQPSVDVVWHLGKEWKENCIFHISVARWYYKILWLNLQLSETIHSSWYSVRKATWNGLYMYTARAFNKHTNNCANSQCQRSGGPGSGAQHCQTSGPWSRPFRSWRSCRRGSWSACHRTTCRWPWGRRTPRPGWGGYRGAVWKKEKKNQSLLKSGFSLSVRICFSISVLIKEEEEKGFERCKKCPENSTSITHEKLQYQVKDTSWRQLRQRISKHTRTRRRQQACQYSAFRNFFPNFVWF